VGPVFVTVEPASTENGAAAPKPTVAVAPRALLAKRRVDSDPSRISPTRNVLRLACRAERRFAARKSPASDSCFGGTPTFIGVS
jgi:hypothetical protein